MPSLDAESLQALDAARAMLPAWAGWAGASIYLIQGLLAGFSGVWLGARLAYRAAPPDEFWTERARRLWPARVVLGASSFALPTLAACTLWRQAGPLSSPGPRLLALLGFLATLIGAVMAWRLLPLRSRWVATGPLERIRWFITQLLVLWPHAAVAIGALILSPRALTVPAVTLLVVTAALLIFFAGGRGIILARWLGLVEPASDRLQAIVAEVSSRMGVKPPPVWESPMGMANAFASMISHELLITREAMTELNDQELASLCTHELGHLEEPRATAVGRAVMWVAILLCLAALPALEGTYGSTGFIVLPLVFVASRVVTVKLTRQMETRADAAAHTHEGDPGTYARTLERIYQLNDVPAVRSRRASSHPELYDRMVSAGVSPDYPRPAPPSGMRSFTGLTASMLVAALIFVSPELAAPWLAGRFDQQEEIQQVLALRHGGRPRQLASLGTFYHGRGDLTKAATLYRAAALTSRGHDVVTYAVAASSMQAYDGRCDEAETTVKSATARHSCDEGELEIAEAWGEIAACRARAMPQGPRAPSEIGSAGGGLDEGR